MIYSYYLGHFQFLSVSSRLCVQLETKHRLVVVRDVHATIRGLFVDWVELHTPTPINWICFIYCSLNSDVRAVSKDH